MVEMFFLPHSAFSRKFNCLYMGVMSLDAPNYLHAAMGNPINPAMYTKLGMTFGGRLTFVQWLINSALYVLFRCIQKYNIGHQDELIARYFGGKLCIDS